jgi:hypothetical protein
MSARLTPEQKADREMTEAALQRRVIYRARKHGWSVVHFHASVVADADGERVYATAISGDAKGFPDLSLYREGRRPLYVELKRELTQPTPEQWAWLDRLIACGQLAMVWRPSDLREKRIEAILR